MAILECSTQTWRDGIEVETTSITYAQSINGVRVVMHTGDKVFIPRKGDSGILRLIGTGGIIEMWPWQGPYRVVNAAHPAGMAFGPPAAPPLSSHRRYLEELAEQIDASIPDYAIPDSSLAALELCEGAYLSSAHHCKVTLPLKDFTVAPEPDWRPGQPYRGHGGRDGRFIQV
jgi:hypothetical protein